MRVEPGYNSLAGVLQRALDQAQSGKGAERHADGKPFEQQPMQRLCELYGPGFALGQAAKKAQESMRMGREPAVRELLGAINYLAGAIIHLERTEAVQAPANDNGEIQCAASPGAEVCSQCARAGRCLAVDHG